MNSILASLYTSYERIYVVHNEVCGFEQVAALLRVNADAVREANSRTLINKLLNRQDSSLVVIDVNSINVVETDYTLFLLCSFLPNTPVVLIANDLSKKAQARYLASGIVAIVRAADPRATIA